MVAILDIDVSPDTRALLDAVHTAGHGVALVGGCVRDAFLKRPIRDIDVVTSASAEALRSICAGEEWCRRLHDVGERYGTIGVVLSDGGLIEVSALRDDDLASDAARRDFTINALAASWPSLVVLDSTGGIEDLHTGLLRAPGNAIDRFLEDPLRVLRAARFVAELGFTLDPATAQGAAQVAARLEDVAVERVRDELTKLVQGPHAGRGLRVALETGALAQVLPEVAALDGVEQPTFHDLDVFSHTAQTVDGCPANPELRWAALLHDIGKRPCRTVDVDGRIRFHGHAQMGAQMTADICERLRFSRARSRAVVHLVAQHMRLSDLETDNPRAVDRAVRRLDLHESADVDAGLLVSAEDALALTLADHAATAHRAETPTVRSRLQGAIEASRARGTGERIVAPLSGRQLMAALGLEEGPRVGAAMRAILNAIAQGVIACDDRSGAIEVAKAALAKSPGAPDEHAGPDQA